LEVGFPHRSLRHYFEGRDSDALPLPPIKRLASGERFELLTGDQSDRATTDILLRWHVLESVVDQVATTGELSCAMKSDAMSRTCRLETSRCGRALRFELLQGRPCLYGDTLTSLGLAGS
jgi:hypothetical protein